MTSRPPVGDYIANVSSEEGGVLLEANPTYSKGTKVFVCEREPANRRRSLLVWAFSAIFSVGAVTAIVTLTFYHQQRSPEPSRDVTAINALVNFHRQLLVFDHQITVASKANDEASSFSTNRNDLLGLFDASNHYWSQLEVIKLKLSALRTPELSSKAANNWASAALAACRDRVMHLEFAQKLVIDSVDRGEFRPIPFGVPNSAIGKSTTDAKNETNDIRRSYEALGVSPERVDFIHGGLSN
jgi:hypothetical protein